MCANRDGGFEGVDDDVLLSLGDHAGAVLQNATLQGERRTSYLATVRVLGSPPKRSQADSVLPSSASRVRPSV